jgi:hypothetical protein
VNRMIAILALGWAGITSKPSNAEELRRSTWTFGLKAVSYQLSSAADSAMIGLGGAVELGYGFLGDNWYWLGAASMISGPFDPVRREQLSLDFTGTGVNVIAAFAPFQSNIRSSRFSFSLFSGIDMIDVIGRSAGRTDFRSNEEVSIDNQETSSIVRQVRSYNMQVNQFSIPIGIAVAALAPARPVGNSPALLKTQLDGILTMIGVSVPVSARYRSRYDQKFGDADYQTSQKKGRLSGVSYYISLTSLIGV